jgi:hypothetical protein
MSPRLILSIVLVAVSGCAHKPPTPTAVPSVAKAKTAQSHCSRVLSDSLPQALRNSIPQALRDSLQIACDEHRYQWLRIF